MAAVREPREPQLAGRTLQFMQRLWDLVHALDVRSKRMSTNLGVTGPQRLVIRILGRSPDSTATDIAVAIGLHPSTLTGILRRLELQGVVQRETDARDRRRARFRLTAKGRRLDRDRKGTVESAVRRALARSRKGNILVTMNVLAELSRELAGPDE